MVLPALACGGGSLAAAEETGPVPDVVVWNEANQSVPLTAVLRTLGDGPVIVLPIFTRCAASCPVLTKKLKKETAGFTGASAYRVVVFSFDPTETAESVRSFREREKVPGSWVIVRAEEKEIRRFFDFLRYRVITEGGVLMHPNKIFLLDREMNWRQTLVGEGWNAASLQESFKEMESSGVAGWAARNPAKVAVLGVCGLFGSFAIFLGWLIFRKPQKHSTAR